MLSTGQAKALGLGVKLLGVALVVGGLVLMGTNLVAGAALSIVGLPIMSMRSMMREVSDEVEYERDIYGQG